MIAYNKEQYNDMNSASDARRKYFESLPPEIKAGLTDAMRDIDRMNNEMHEVKSQDINSQPKSFVRKASPVHAMRWTGSKESAELIKEWLNHDGILPVALYYPAQDAMDDGRIGCPFTPAHMEFHLNGVVENAKAGDIITLENNKIAVFGSYVFFERYV